jgi:hypothetical protein
LKEDRGARSSTPVDVEAEDESRLDGSVDDGRGEEGAPPGSRAISRRRGIAPDEEPAEMVAACPSNSAIPVERDVRETRPIVATRLVTVTTPTSRGVADLARRSPEVELVRRPSPQVTI